jgi:hypothetical protein
MTTIPQTAASKVAGAFDLFFKHKTLLLSLALFYLFLSVIVYFIASAVLTNPSSSSMLAESLFSLPILPFIIALACTLVAYNYKDEGRISLRSYFKEGLLLGFNRYFPLLFATIFYISLSLSPLLPGIICLSLLERFENHDTLLLILGIFLLLAGLCGSIFLMIRFTLVMFIIVNEKLSFFESFSHSAYRIYGLKKQYLGVALITFLLVFVFIVIASFLAAVALLMLNSLGNDTSFFSLNDPFIFMLISSTICVLTMLFAYQIDYYFYAQTRDKE